MLNDAMKGRISAGKSKKGDAPDQITITITGEWAYALQNFLESEVSKGGDFPRVRWLVLIAETLRAAVADAKSKGGR
jgi:hypothetical protein